MLIVIACLLLLPLSIRYLTTWRMAILRDALRNQEADVAELKERYLQLREELRVARSLARMYEVRRSFISSDIEAERKKLITLRSVDDTARIAA